jgi:glycosyltransferase involved in cell wall biosynthesis
MQSTPLITIITPVYNSAEFLEELIISVLDQDYPCIEHIIIDDGSDDLGATISILKKYPHLRWWSRENRGQYYSMNEGLIAARGEIICFICADDIMARHAIKNAIDWLINNPKFEAVYGLTAYKKDRNESVKIQHLVGYFPYKYYPYYPYTIQFQHCSLYIRKNLLIEKELYLNPQLNFVGDYDWIIRVIKSGTRLGFLNKVLSIVRFHHMQISSLNKTKMAKEKLEVAKSHGYKGMAFLYYFKILRNMLTNSKS